jgi:hypothetical protein
MLELVVFSPIVSDKVKDINLLNQSFHNFPT